MRVSVVIPSYNVAAFLPQAIESVRAQTRPVHEVIVVDDGSTDGTGEVAARLGAICLRTPSNAGPGAARNLGVRAATGDVVAFLDGDDSWDREHCETTVQLLERFADVALAHARVRKFGTETYTPQPPIALPPGVPSAALLTLLEYNTIPQSGVVVRRSVFLEAGGYNESMRYSEDFDLWLRLARRHRFVSTGAVTTNYRVHGAQATQSRIALVRGAWEARRRLWRECSDHPAESRAEIAGALRRAWEIELRIAWRQCDRELFDTVLAQRDAVPDSEAIHDRWVRRVRRYWSLWVPAMALWDTLPQRAKNMLKLPVRTLRGRSASPAARGAARPSSRR